MFEMGGSHIESALRTFGLESRNQMHKRKVSFKEKIVLDNISHPLLYPTHKSNRRLSCIIFNNRYKSCLNIGYYMIDGVCYFIVTI